MTIHDPNLTPSARAILAAGAHLRRKDAGDPFEVLTKKFGDHADATIRRIAEADQRIAETGERLAHLEQKTEAAQYGGGPVRPQSWGEQFTGDHGLKAFAEEASRPSRFRMQMKGTLTTGATSGGSLAVPTRDPAAAMLPKRRLTVRDLLTVLRVSSGSVEYVAQTVRPGAAGTVAEGAVKPESEAAFELRRVDTRVIAHWLPASRQILEDAPQLQGTIDVELRYGLALKEEEQLLNGDGLGANLDGFIPSATAFADPMGLPSPTMIDTIGSAVLQAALAEFPADGIVIHPADWMRMRLLKDTDGKYLLGDPQADVEPRLFGLPVVPTQAMAVDTFLVGAFAQAGTLYDRWEARVEVSTEHADFFTRNLVAVLAEERLGLAVKQPGALVSGSFGNAA